MRHYTSGNNRNLFVVNATLTNGSKGAPYGGYYFNGTNAYLCVSNFPVQTNNSFSWSIWIKPNYLPTNNSHGMAVMNLRSGVGQYERSPFMAIGGGTSSSWATFWSYTQISAPTDTYPGFSQVFTPEKSITPNAWQHLAVTSDSNNVRKIYLDGKLKSTGASSGYGDRLSTLLIGADIRDSLANSASFFSGSISAIRVYDRPLSDTEVGAINLLERPLYEVTLTTKSSTNLNEWTSVLTNKIETYNPTEFYKNDISVTIKPPAP
jgi:Concanavalin A-like lectin/glucanases superfamily